MPLEGEKKLTLYIKILYSIEINIYILNTLLNSVQYIDRKTYNSVELFYVFLSPPLGLVQNLNDYDFSLCDKT